MLAPKMIVIHGEINNCMFPGCASIANVRQALVYRFPWCFVSSLPLRTRDGSFVSINMCARIRAVKEMPFILPFFS